MGQQQLTESQLSITHEVLIETETKFRNALTANKSTAEKKQIQIIKIIPPFSRESVKSAENLAQAYRSCASDILKEFPATKQQKELSLGFLPRELSIPVQYITVIL